MPVSSAPNSSRISRTNVSALALAELDAAAERAVEDDIPRRIVAAKDQQPILVQEDAEHDRANPTLVHSAPTLP